MPPTASQRSGDHRLHERADDHQRGRDEHRDDGDDLPRRGQGPSGPPRRGRSASLKDKDVPASIRRCRQEGRRAAISRTAGAPWPSRREAVLGHHGVQPLRARRRSQRSRRRVSGLSDRRRPRVDLFRQGLRVPPARPRTVQRLVGLRDASTVELAHGGDPAIPGERRLSVVAQHHDRRIAVLRVRQHHVPRAPTTLRSRERLLHVADRPGRPKAPSGAGASCAWRAGEGVEFAPVPRHRASSGGRPSPRTASVVGLHLLREPGVLIR